MNGQKINNPPLNFLPKIREEGCNKKGFTLVELIVVITIIAILGTIAFISLQGYSTTARDSTRISDVSTIKTSLELFHLNAGKYPLPDNEYEVSYSGELLWSQGKLGEVVIKNLSRNLHEIPKDPLTDKEYIYSVSNKKNEYQILSLLENDDFAFTSPQPSPLRGEGVSSIFPQTNAEGTLKVIAKLDGEYNGVFVKSSNYIVPTPSIINAEVNGAQLILNNTNIKSQVLNKGLNIPEYGNIISKTGALNMNLSVYTGSITKKSTNQEKLNVIQSIKNAYTGSILTSDLKINKILTTTDTKELIALTETVVLNNPSFSTNGGQEEQTPTPINCPVGYVLVPGNPTFSTSDFCVAKYEMKIQGTNTGTTTYVSSMVAESRATGTPWVSITQPKAITECNALGTGFHLITNNEWMTVSRNIESNIQNWSGTVLYSGHNDNSPANSLAASTDDNDGYNGTGNSSGNQKRTHILSNGQVIWDISGNVREHVNGTNNVLSTTGVVTNGQACSTTLSNWYSFYGSDTAAGGTCSFISPYSKLNHGPLLDYNANNGVGRIYSSTSTDRIFLRGAYWNSTTAAGVFELYLGINSLSSSTGIGFRCSFSVN